MNSYEDRELARDLQALASQISVPEGRLSGRRGSGLGRALSVAGAVAVLFAAIAIGAAINNLRSESDNSGVAATPTPTATPPVASPSPSPSATLVFPDYPLLAGTIDGLVYRIEGGQVRGSPANVCGGQTVLALQPSSTGRSVLVICGGHPPGQARAVVLDASTLAQRAGPITVLPRFDVGAWAPDERTIALLQEGVCEPQAPVCSVHVLLWDLANGSTRVIRPDEPLTGDIRWTVAGLSIALPQGSRAGTYIWNGQMWSRYSTHALRIADGSGRALLVDAGTGNWGGRVWLATGGQEVALTASGTEYPLGLDGDRAIVWRDEPVPNGAMVVYRGQQVESVVPTERYCGQAQQIQRWIVCTTAGSSALAYSLDAKAFARMPIAGLGSYNVLVVLPRN